MLKENPLKKSNPYKILAKVARMAFIYKVLRFRLKLFKSDYILDYGDHAIITLKNIPGVIILKLEETKEVITHYEAYLLSEGEQSYLDCFYLNETFPTGSAPVLTLVKK